MQPSRDISRLLDIMAALRAPRTGCPWDLEQDFASIAPYTIEEAYEVADAISRGDMADLREELGDLLLQVVFHARMGEEMKLFDFGDVVEAITAKLIRRHPHVFGEAREMSSESVGKLWGEIKAAEKAEQRVKRAVAGLPAAPDGLGILAGVPANLPALTRAVKLQRQAATVGFDWNDARLVLAKIREATAEIEAALDQGEPADRVGAEIGDLLFAVANLARHLDADPEAVTRGANAKFERRFAFIEAALACRGSSLADARLDEMDQLWNEAKKREA